MVSSTGAALGAVVATGHHGGSDNRPRLIPQPSSLRATGSACTITAGTRIRVPWGRADAYAVGAYLADVLRPSTGYPLEVVTCAGPGGDIVLEFGGGPELGQEGYELRVSHGQVRIIAQACAGLFYGVQTLRQLLPPRVESRDRQHGPWSIPGVHVVDGPRFAWRGVMLDVARHFFTVDEVKSYIDLASMYKLNHLHLHLTDNEGWRIDIESWPRLARYGGSTEAGGGPGGYYTHADYAEIVRHAAARFMTIVPEIDTPGHVTAALASYAELNCDGVAPPLLSGGYSSLCVRKPITYRFLDDVIGELSAITPGAYIHMGGDEALSTSAEDYVYFVERMQRIVHAHGKKLTGWHQIDAAEIAAGQLAQYWGLSGSAPDEALALRAKSYGDQLVMSPADKVYLDMKYNPQSPIGQNWAGYNSVQDSYSWDPATFVPGITESNVRGVEAPLWTDLLSTVSQLQYMTFPRLPGVAEIGWSPKRTHSWEDYRIRLAAQGPRWDILGINYYRSPQVPWQG
jgi:hexosaminidase